MRFEKELLLKKITEREQDKLSKELLSENELYIKAKELRAKEE